MFPDLKSVCESETLWRAPLRHDERAFRSAVQIRPRSSEETDPGIAVLWLVDLVIWQGAGQAFLGETRPIQAENSLLTAEIIVGLCFVVDDGPDAWHVQAGVIGGPTVPLICSKSLIFLNKSALSMEPVASRITSRCRRIIFKIIRTTDGAQVWRYGFARPFPKKRKRHTLREKMWR